MMAREPLIESGWILTNLAKPLRTGLKARFFVVLALDLRMTKAGSPRLE
jgi:hypothetical protein